LPPSLLSSKKSPRVVTSVFSGEAIALALTFSHQRRSITISNRGAGAWEGAPTPGSQPLLSLPAVSLCFAEWVGCPPGSHLLLVRPHAVAAIV
jgi:hypothetical protein